MDSGEHEDKVESKDGGGGEFDVESDEDRNEGNVALNLDLRVVIDEQTREAVHLHTHLVIEHG